MSSLYPAKKRAQETYTTEFDILKGAHKFLRSDAKDMPKSWDAQLAKKYEDSLFKEFAICDLKHYKSGDIALRWRTEDEVLSGAGETSCGNTRCSYYDTPSRGSQDILPKPPKLRTLELPFSYVEQGETKAREAMVKAVLCERCVKKLMWNREREKKVTVDSAGEPASTARADDTVDSQAYGSSSRKRRGKQNARVQESGRSRSTSPRRYHRNVIPHVE